MTVYLVQGKWEAKTHEFNNLYGVFSSAREAVKIKRDIEESMTKWGESEMIEIKKVVVDKPTELYEFMMKG